MLKDHPLKSLNTWGVGGVCSLYSVPASPAEVRETLIYARRNERKVHVLGGGSNILVSDEYIPDVVLHTGGLRDITIRGEGSNGIVYVEVGAGFPVKSLLAAAIKNRLGGLEFLTGIPGTVGGALWGNAGARGEGFAPMVKSIEVIDSNAEELTLSAADLKWAYRECPCDTQKAAVITKCLLELRARPVGEIFDRIKSFAELKKRQPLGRKTAGCIFKNPQGYSAGKLLDEAGCIGLTSGDARVSPSHANFIENNGSATAREIFDLCEICRKKVLTCHGIRLDYEIKFFGTFTKD